MRERYADLTAVFPTRTDFTDTYTPADLFDQARTVDAVGLSLNLLCQQYPDKRLRGLVRVRRARATAVHRPRRRRRPPLRER